MADGKEILRKYEDFIEYLIEETTPRKRELMKRKYAMLKNNEGRLLFK